MSRHKRYQPFRLRGQFLGFIHNDEGKPKYLHLGTCEGERHLKIPKELRFVFGRTLVPGMWVQVQGEQVTKEGEVKWVAYHVQPEQSSPDPLPSPASPLPKACPGSILVCQKSDCQKRGAWAVLEALDSCLQEHPDGERIRVQRVGCLKRCESGPNLVVMPAKERYSRILPQQIPALLERHFPAQPIVEPLEAGNRPGRLGV